jgi:rRNA processing
MSFLFVAANHRKMYQKAQLKRQYQKVLKQEGMTTDAAADQAPAKGAKRSHNSDDDESDDEPAASPPHKSGKAERSAKPDPFREAKLTAGVKRQEVANAKAEKAASLHAKEERLQERKRKHALLSQRTRTGQPVMKNQIFNLLEKIKSG